MIVPREVVCAFCHKIEVATKTEEELTVEAQQLFGPIAPKDLIEICDDCFVWALWFRTLGVEAN
jgi:hypothetical protein